MNRKNIDEIVLAKVAGQELTKDELEQFDVWYADEANRSHYESLLRVRSSVIASEAAKVNRAKAWKRVSPPAPRLSVGRRVLRYVAILAIPVLFGAGYLFYQNRQAAMADNIVVKPGSALAILTSPSGQRLVFSETEETRIENGSGVINIKGSETLDAARGILVDQNGNIHDWSAEDVVYSTLEIPRGGYICYILSDSSKVWLNCESKLRFPAVFPPGERRVELEGEAYFEVAKDESRPFIVKTGDYDIRVTGTSFNVRSYTHGQTATTLVEGGVEIEMNGTVSKLVPNQQATVSGSGIAVRDVSVDRYVAWQQGAFSYSQTPLGEIMEELSRWYDIDVVWKDKNARNYHFSAWFARKSDVSEIIEVLEKTNRVEMTLKGRTLTIKDK